MSPLTLLRRAGWPRLCALCRSWTDRPLCPACEADAPRLVGGCARCAVQLAPGQACCRRCLAEPPPFDAALAALPYATPWAELIARFKYQGQPALARTLAARLVDAAYTLHRAAPGHPAVAGAMPTPPGSCSSEPPLVLPIPVSARRLQERGYNQAWELARRVARAQQLPADAHLLLRLPALQRTGHQVGLGRQERLHNQQGAFAVEPSRRAELRGRRVLLVDDVMTTGATLAEAARVLKQAGAANVVCWVLARA